MIVVADVNTFPGHIACDARSASEIVIPWKNRDGEVSAVFDVDSMFPGAFDTVDRDELLALAADLTCWARSDSRVMDEM